MTTSANALTIMTALVAGSATSKEVAAKTGLNLPVVTGSLAALKKNGFVAVSELGLLSLTPSGMCEVGPVVAEAVEPTGALTKKEQAFALFEKLGGRDTKRAVVLDAFVEALGMTRVMASTYHNKFRHGWK